MMRTKQATSQDFAPISQGSTNVPIHIAPVITDITKAPNTPTSGTTTGSGLIGDDYVAYGKVLENERLEAERKHRVQKEKMEAEELEKNMNSFRSAFDKTIAEVIGAPVKKEGN